MTFLSRFDWRLGLVTTLALGAVACQDELTDSASSLDVASELPEAPANLVPDGHVVLGEFEVFVDPASEQIDVRWLDPDAWHSELPMLDHLRVEQQGEFCEIRVTEGRPNTVSLETLDGTIGYDMASCGVSGFPFDTLGVFCFDARLTNNYGVPLTEAYAELTQIIPDVGHNGYRYDPLVQTAFGADPATVGLDAPPSERPSDLLGLFGFGQVPAGGSVTDTWGFEYTPEPFSFRGRIVGIIPETCDGLDNDCDGDIDERGLCFAGTDPCLFDDDCASGFCDGGTCSVTDLCTSGALDSLETDVDCGGPICAGCSYGQMCDENADCASGFCRGGFCANERHPTAGEVIVSEVMANPNGSESSREWFEVYNTTTETLDLGLCTLGEINSGTGDPTAQHTIATELLIAPGDYLVLANDPAPPGFTPDYAYSSYFLSNSGDEIIIDCSTGEVDRLEYSSGFDVAGFASQLDVNALDATSNDDEANYCTLGGTEYEDATSAGASSGNVGSPGTANVSCDVTIDRCRFADPLVDFSAPESSNFTLRGQLRSAGLTDQAVGYNPYARIVAEVGYGPVADDPSVDPSTWTWSAASGDNTFSDATDDQYTGDIATPAGAGTFKVAFRVSGDNGATFTYCDLDQGAGADGSEDGFALADVPTMTLTAPVAQPSSNLDVRISEIMARSISGADNGEWFELWNPGTSDFDLGGCEICDDACDGGSNDHTIAGSLIIPAGGYLTFGQAGVVGFTPDYTYTGVVFSNSGEDELQLNCGGTMIDFVGYDGGTADPLEIAFDTSTEGISMQLIPDDINRLAIHGDPSKTWCTTLPSNLYGNNGSNDLIGTPGAANPECVQLTNCNTQFPTSITGVAPSSLNDVFGQLTTVELTGLTNGADTSPILVVQAGTGTTDPNVDAAAWTWVDAAANQAFTNGSGIDEYVASIQAPATGSTTVNYGYRASADGGANWLYCDLGDITTAGALDGWDSPADLTTDGTYTIDFCNLQFPDNITNDPGQTARVYNQMYIAGVTDGGGTYSPTGSITSQFGYSTSGNAPNDVDWTWAVSNGGTDVGSNYEFFYDLTVPTAVGGPYETAFRITGDGGATWTYCGTSNTFNTDSSLISRGAINPAERTPGYVVQNFPTTITDDPGTEYTVFGLYYALGLTDQTDGLDINTDVEAEFGYGSNTSTLPADEASWTWVTATPNLAWNDGGCCGPDNNNDEFQATFNLPLTPGTYRTAFRFRGNSTQPWVYGDIVGNPWSTANTGTMTVNSVGGACSTGVLFSEYIEGSSFNKMIEIWNCSGGAVAASDVEVTLYYGTSPFPGGTSTLAALDPGLGSIAAGDVYTICHPSYALPNVGECDLFTSTIANFNGDDTLILTYQTIVVDSLGLLLAGPNYGANQTFERNNCIGDGDPLTDGTTGTQNFTSYASNTERSVGAAPAGVVCP